MLGMAAPSHSWPGRAAAGPAHGPPPRLPHPRSQSMPEPVNIGLTARVAAEERARRADLVTGEHGIDIVVIDDQPDHEAGWVARHLPGHRRLSLESVSGLERFLAGQRLPNLPPQPDKPALAIPDPTPAPG